MQLRSVFKIGCLLLFLVSTARTVFAQHTLSEHTLGLKVGDQQQKSDIDAMQWLSGSWRGEGMGAKVEEIWSEPASGGMMGMFQMTDETGVIFYELCQIVEKDGSLILRLKHFDRELNGWEEKEEVVEFPLVKIKGKQAWFEGLTYQLVGDTLLVWVVIEEGEDGSQKEGSFRFTRN